MGKKLLFYLGFSSFLLPGYGVDLTIPWMKMVPEDFASKCGHCPRKVSHALLDYYTDRRVIGNQPTTIFDLELRDDGHWQATTFRWNCEVAQIPSERWNNEQNPLVIRAPGVEDRRFRDDPQNQQSKTFEPFGFKLTTRQNAGRGEIAQSCLLLVIASYLTKLRIIG